MLFAQSNPSRILTDREPTDREQLLAERLMHDILEIKMIQDCEAVVSLDEPTSICVVLSGESGYDVTLSKEPDFDVQAVYKIIRNTMSNENVTISNDNISIVY